MWMLATKKFGSMNLIKTSIFWDWLLSFLLLIVNFEQQEVMQSLSMKQNKIFRITGQTFIKLNFQYTDMERSVIGGLPENNEDIVENETEQFSIIYIHKTNVYPAGVS